MLQVGLHRSREDLAFFAWPASLAALQIDAFVETVALVADLPNDNVNG